MKLIVKAYRYAAEKHAGQVRRGSGEPYITHPIAVAGIVSAFKTSKHFEEIVAAAYLHDVCEDCGVTAQEIESEFGSLVAQIVTELTNDEAEIERIGKLEYHKKKFVEMSNYSLVIKLADRLHNILGNPTKNMVLNTCQLMQYLSQNRDLTSTQHQLVSEILEAVTEKIKGF